MHRVGRTPGKAEDRGHPRRAPVRGAAQAAGAVIDFPEIGAVPGVGLADRPQRALQRFGNARGLGQAARHRMLEREQLSGALVLGDIPADADVTPEAASVLEDRLGAQRQPDHPAVVREALDLEIAEGLVALDLGAVPVPVRLRQVERGLIPALAAEVGRQIHARLLRRAARHEGEAQLGVLLPIPVAGELAEAAEAEFARAPHVVRFAQIERNHVIASYFCELSRSRAAVAKGGLLPLASNLLERYPVVQR